jgi:hypothetical protein
VEDGGSPDGIFGVEDLARNKKSRPGTSTECPSPTSSFGGLVSNKWLLI